MSGNIFPKNPYKTSSHKGYISNITLILAAFASAFFPRIIQSLGAPSPVNFLHFFTVPLACVIVFLRCRRTSYKQIAMTRSLFVALYIYFGINAASAFLNNAGAVNIFLNFMIQAEPFMVLIAIVYIPLNFQKLERFRTWALRFFLLNLVIALIQAIGLYSGIMPYPTMTMEDNVQGVFYLSSGGHVVSASVSLIYALYYFTRQNVPLAWTRYFILFGGLFHVYLADSKQTILVGIAAWILLIISRSTDIKATLKYVIIATIVLYSFYWCVYNVDALQAYRTWIRPEIYGPDGDATVQKLFPVRNIPTYYTSLLNWFLGLGPGHTLGRIGGWMIRDYASILAPLGATRHPASQAAWNVWNGSYLDSSFFSPFWGFVGIWGDVGFLGLGTYLTIWWIVWIKVCKDDFSRFLVLNVLVNGFIFTTMEEPGFMLSTAVLLGLRWHELNPHKPDPNRQTLFEGANMYLT
ncbi:hypothetical protein IQ273_11165 [Nodosilinea sp. LEGE 07298]|uniref:hypothetical protein n=1 Tax=Nodosilinea sp. LEGE 07298 TaxID=2777970 RepID=UPI0018827EDF|nr:hypothetical protein [Nodosilinea sp. LEGE 07298]MBE9109968.1 hypothetical protein [Nodosilinea sp. LEGE 07298]